MINKRKGKSKAKWTVAAVQMTSTEDVEANCRKAERYIRRAVEAGADLVALPENFAFLKYEGSPETLRVPIEGDLVRGFRELADDLGCYLLLGSIPEAVPRSRKHYNTSLLLGPRGEILSHYRKIHLFDIDIPGGVSFQESKNVVAGGDLVVAPTLLGRLGLTICYDLRFPELYRQLALSGADVLFVPAAFTAFTGKAHWLPLLRARAIENLCWVVAPAQVGRHNAKRESHGETVIINPWGDVIRRQPRREGPVLADIDLNEVVRAREGLPCLSHVRREMFRDPLPRRKRRGHGSLSRR